jgi:folylpolyglutamate synthase
VAEKNGAIFEIVPSIPTSLELGLRGKHQIINASLAVALARKFLATRKDSTVQISADLKDPLPDSFVAPLAETRWPGRCQMVQKPGSSIKWYLDGAHTVESLTSCGEWAWGAGDPKVLIFNCSGGRAGESLLSAMLDAGAKASNKTVEELGKGFASVVFCTNVTYADGHFKGGE